MSEHATIHVMRLIFAFTIMRQYAIIYFEYGQFNRCGNIYPLVYLSKHLISNGNILRKNSPLPNEANTHRISYLTNLFWQDQSYRMSYSMGFIRTDTFQAGKLCVFLCMLALLMHSVFVALHLLSLQYPSFDIQFLFRSVDLLHFISLLLRILGWNFRWISGRKIFFYRIFSIF